MPIIGGNLVNSDFGLPFSEDHELSLDANDIALETSGGVGTLVAGFEFGAAGLALTSSGLAALGVNGDPATLQGTGDLVTMGVAELLVEKRMAAAATALDSSASTAVLEPQRNLSAFAAALTSTAAADLAAEQFTPALISGLELWLDAGQGVTTDGSNGVDEWQDQSGNSRNVTPFTATKPTLNSSNANFNSEPTIDFATGDDGLSGLFKVIGRGNTTMTLIMVCKFTQVDSTFPYWYEEFDSVGLGTTTIDNTLQFTSSGSNFLPEFRFQNGSGLVGTNSTVNETTNCIIVHAGTGYPGFSGLVVAINGDEGKNNDSGWAGGSPTSPDTADSTLIGGNHFGSTTRNCEGSIAEVLVYDKDLTTDELNDVTKFLCDKYGITHTTI